MTNVLIPTKLDKTAAAMLMDKGYQVVQDAETPIDELVAKHPETEAMIVRSEKITAEIIDKLPNLRLIVRAGAGYNTIDINYARRKDVDVMNTPGANANAVAEEVFAMALAAYRFVIPGDISTRAGKWEKKKFLGRELTGKTLGIVGLGNIGQLVAKHATGFDMKLLAYDPVVSAAKADEVGIKLVDLQTIFAESDIITLHIPENNETRGLINASLLDLTKPGAMLINCARAGIVNEDDIRAAKAAKGLLFCNDVYGADAEGEKSVADIADVMLPHLGANTKEANFVAACRSSEQLIAYFEQGITRFVVNKGVPDGLDANYQKLAFNLATVARAIIGKDATINNIKCYFYGALQPFGKWFVAPLYAGLSGNYDPTHTPDEAIKSLKDNGIELSINDGDNTKHYGNSMTIDVTGRGSNVSLRGTITENNHVICRINDYDRIYVIPKGNIFMIDYADRPGVLAIVTKALAEAGINIDNIHAPHDAEGKNSISVVMTDKKVPEDVVEALKAEVNARFAVSMTL